jgi:hypothetical protein
MEKKGVFTKVVVFGLITLFLVGSLGSYLFREFLC